MKEQLATLHNALLQKTEIEGLAFLAEQFPNEIVFSTSFGSFWQTKSLLVFLL